VLHQARPGQRQCRRGLKARHPAPCVRARLAGRSRWPSFARTHGEVAPEPPPALLCLSAPLLQPSLTALQAGVFVAARQSQPTRSAAGGRCKKAQPAPDSGELIAMYGWSQLVTLPVAVCAVTARPAAPRVIAGGLTTQSQHLHAA
jgi:hypothetical protein